MIASDAEWRYGSPLNAAVSGSTLRSRSSSSSLSRTPSVCHSLAHGMFDDERAQAKRPPAGQRTVPWAEVHTDKTWIAPSPNQLDTRCEPVRHVQSLLPEGNTAIERKQLRERGLPARLPSGPAQWAQKEAPRSWVRTTDLKPP